MLYKSREHFEEELVKAIQRDFESLSKSEKKKKKKGRCWEGYEPTPGKEAYEDGSCQPISKEEVAPEGSTNRKTYLKEFCKSDEIVISVFSDGDLEIEAGDDVPDEYFQKACEEFEKKEWSPKSEHKSKSGGLTQAGVESYRRANPGSKLKTAVTESKPSGKRAARRKSFCARNKGQIDMHNIDCKKDPKKRACLARKKWKCKN